MDNKDGQSIGHTEADGYIDNPESPLPVLGVISDDNGNPVYRMNGKTVDRVTWMRDGLSQFLNREMPGYVDRLEKKAFGNIKNYLHNTLGLTRNYVEGMISNIIHNELKKIVRRILGLDETQNGAQSTVFTRLIRQEIVDQLRLVSKTSSLEDYVKAQVQKQIEAHVISRLKVDIRVTSVNPEEGVDREVISPEPFRGVREV